MNDAISFTICTRRTTAVVSKLLHVGKVLVWTLVEEIAQSLQHISSNR